MRFIIHEQAYERPLLAGRLRYERDGQPTGAVESWRLTSAVDGYRFLRVDLDARDAPSGRSFLFHLTQDPADKPEQLKYRFWGDRLEVSGTILWEGDEMVAARRVNGTAYEDTARARAFWFPSGVGLGLLHRSAGETTGATLATGVADPAHMMALVEAPVSIELSEAEPESSNGEILPVRALTVVWANSRRTVWVDAEGRPLRLEREDGLMAVAERMVRYGA